MECKYCKGRCIKKGLYKGAQKYQCRACKIFQRSKYRQNTYDEKSQQQVTLLNNEGMGISSISRILQIPKSAVQQVLLKASQRIKAPELMEAGQIYEIDELHACSKDGSLAILSMPLTAGPNR
jgi:insertion element IS1 protein InsB